MSELRPVDEGRAQEPAAAMPVREAVLEWAQLDQLNALRDEQTPTFLHDLIELFLRETPGRLKELALAQVAGDAETLAAVAHTLKGACANFGARQLQVCCAGIEERARRHEWSGMADHVAQAQSAFTRLVEALKVQQRRLTP